MAESSHQFNFFRKTWHILGLAVPACLYGNWFEGAFGFVYATRAILVLTLGTGISFLIVIEFFRLKNPAFEEFFYKVFGFLMKESERKRINGTLPYFLANFLVVLLLPAEIAILSILFLVVGDPFAAFFGSKFGKNRFYNGKSWAGVIGFLGSAFFAGLLVLVLFTYAGNSFSFSLWRENSFQWWPILLLALGVLIACLTEFFCPTTFFGMIDDNLLIPLVSGTFMVVLCSFQYPKPYFPWVFPVLDLFLRF